MAKTKFTPPNLSNATLPFLIDEAGKLRDEIKELEPALEFYKQAIKSRMKKDGLGAKAGDKYLATLTVADRVSLDTAAIKAEMGEDWCADRSRVTPVTTLKIDDINNVQENFHEDIAE